MAADPGADGGRGGRPGRRARPRRLGLQPGARAERPASPPVRRRSRPLSANAICSARRTPRSWSQSAAGARYSFVVSKQRNEALFLGTNLPDPGAGKAYQLWTLVGKTVVPDDMVRGYGQTKKWFSGPIDASTQLAVSVEPAGGSTDTHRYQGRHRRLAQAYRTVTRRATDRCWPRSSRPARRPGSAPPPR